MLSASDKPPLPLEMQHRLDSCCDRFEQACQSGEVPDIEVYLENFSGELQGLLRQELLAIELAYRQTRDVDGPPTAGPLKTQTVQAPPAEVRKAGGTHGGPVGRISQQAGKDSRGLHIRCPHCQAAVELLADTPMEEITCGTCGDSFSLVERDGHPGLSRPLQLVGRFELVSRLGVGGFGTVWKAVDTELDRAVALKIPRKGQLSTQETEQFLREARAAAQIKHPNIVPVHEVGRHGDALFIVTDLIHGTSLGERIKSHSFSFCEAAGLCATVAEALEFAHQKKIVHRDLKPSNIMIDETGSPHVMDFGLAKREVGEVTMTIEGQILGTPAYMSPEQAEGRIHWVDRRTDVYSLGVILFQLLTQELPFRGGLQQQIQQRILEDAPSPRKLNPYIPLDLATICCKCLERDPNRRYSTAAELADELHRFIQGKPIKARPISAAGRVWRWSKRNPAPSAAAALTVFLAVAGPFTAAVIQAKNQRIQNQLGKIRSQLDERNEVIADYERRIDDHRRTYRELADQHQALLGARPGVAEIVPDWRKRLITRYLELNFPDIEAPLRRDEAGVHERVRAHIGLAYLLQATDQSEQAVAHFEAAIELLTGVANRNPDAENVRIALADCHRQLCRVQRDLGRQELAKKSAERALAIRRVLADGHPRSAEFQIALFDSVIESDKVLEVTPVLQRVEKNLSVSPVNFYELACYLTLREPLLHASGWEEVGLEEPDLDVTSQDRADLEEADFHGVDSDAEDADSERPNAERAAEGESTS